jgi:nicotinamide phosphoribosyltransferase
MSHLWYPLTVCTQSRDIKKIIKQFMDETSTNPGAIGFMLHDFGCRGTSSMATSSVGGSAHLVNFQGSDTIPCMGHIMTHYGSAGMPGFSVNASEHSIMTSMAEVGEVDVLEKLLRRFTTGVLSLVIDSYDQYRATETLTTTLLPLVQARSGKVVLRPDSGEPVDVIKRLFEILSRNLASFITVNSKGFKVLPPFIGIIYGDGLSPAKIQQLLTVMKDLGWAADNIVFGMGGGLLQKVDRDTCRFAWKCCALQTADGVWNDVYKDPCDGKGTSDSKASLRGRQKVIKVDGVYTVVREDSVEHAHLKNE